MNNFGATFLPLETLSRPVGPPPLSVSLTLPLIQILPQLTIHSAFGPSVGISPTVEVPELNREDKMIAEVVRLGLAVVRRYPNECAAFALGFCIAALRDAARNN